jgi:quercetin dioxygenase-like cupin family protein
MRPARYALADALGVPFGSLTAATGPQVDHLRAADRALVGGALQARVLTQAAGAKLVEALDIVFPAGQTRRSNPHPAGVIEHILLTEGRLRAGPENALTDIDAGDVLRFPGDVPHSYAALDGAPARAIALMAY